MWNKDLAAGQLAEQWLLDQYRPRLSASTNLKWDINSISGKKIELKLERRPEAKLKNLFVEIVSNDNKCTLGGPLRSLIDNVDFFVFIVSDTKRLFIFRTPELVERIQTLIDTLDLKVVENQYYNTLGYAVPIEALEDLNLEVDVLWN